MQKIPESVQPQEKYSTIKQAAKILVMDDDEMILDIMTEMLTGAGHVVETSKDGKQAIEMYKQSMYRDQPFECVIVDLTIPGGIGGEDVVEEIVKIDPKARVIVSSGYAEGPIMANYASYGFKGVVAKPYSVDRLCGVVDAVLNEL